MINIHFNYCRNLEQRLAETVAYAEVPRVA